MTKLTTGRLEKLQDNLLQFQDAYSDPEDKENYDIFVDALHVLDEFKAAKEKLLAYEQAAKNPVAEMGVARTPLYGAPVLPKQPDATITNEGDITKIIKAAEKLVRCKGRYHSEQNYRALAALFGVTVPDFPPLPSDEAPAQPVIPEEKSAIHRTKEPEDIAFNNGFAAGWNCCRSEVISLNETTAQPVSEPYKSAANDIIAERQRQISEEGWTPEHDDKYNDFQLALAAAGYAQNVADYAGEYCQPHSSINWTDAPEPEAWPWSPVWWKPTNPRRDLVKSGALILAEIERLDRAATAQEQK